MKLIDGLTPVQYARLKAGIVDAVVIRKNIPQHQTETQEDRQARIAEESRVWLEANAVII